MIDFYDIIIRISAMEMVKVPMNRVIKNTNLAKKRLAAFDKVSKATNINMDRLRGVLAKANIGFSHQGKWIDSITGKKLKHSQVTDRVSLATKKFNMELLSVMFLAMGVAGAITTMLNPSFQAVGIFSLWGETMKVLFLPVALGVLYFMLMVSKLFMNLPAPVKEVIGAILLVVKVMIALLGVFAAVKLGLFGLMLMFKVTTVGALMTALAPFALIAVALVALFLAFKYNLFGIRDMVASIFKGIGRIINGIVEIFMGIINLDFPRIQKGFTEVLGGLKNIFLDTIGILIEGIKKGVYKIYNWFTSLGSWLWNWFWYDLLPWMGNIGTQLVEKIVKGLKAVAYKIKNAVKDAFKLAIEIFPTVLQGPIKDVLGIQSFAQGGIVTRPTLAMVGEAGPEAIVPLSGAAGLGGVNIVNNFYGITDTDKIVREVNSSVRHDLNAMMRR